MSKKKEWSVEFKIKGTAYLTVHADTQEEAETEGWRKYHAGTELEDLSWEADSLSAEEAS